MKNTDDHAGKRVFVKVFGFTDSERHALNTAFLLSGTSQTIYTMWSAEAEQPAQLAFLDGESWEASLEMANPEHDALKLIWVGSHPPAKAWQIFQRPLKWAAIIEALDRFYAPLQHMPEPAHAAADVDIDFDLDFDIQPQPDSDTVPQGQDDIDAITQPQPLALAGGEPHETGNGEARSRILLIDSDRAARLYWRAKLAAAGHLLVDDASTGEAALQLVRFNVYTMVVLDMELTDVSSWALFKALKESAPPIGHLILTGTSLTLWDRIRARFSGARGALRKPLHPGKVKQLLENL